MRSNAWQETLISLGCYAVAALALGAGMWLAVEPVPGSASRALSGSGRPAACQTCIDGGRSDARLAELDP